MIASITRTIAPPELKQLAWGSVATIALVALTVWTTRRNGHTLDDAGMAFRPRSVGLLFAGFLIALVVYTVTFITDHVVAGPISLVRVPSTHPGTLLLMIATFLALGAMEEIGFRGYPLRMLVQRIGNWRAQLLVAVAFSATHVLFGWSVAAIVLGVFPSALLFGATALLFRDISAAIGVHAGLNVIRWTMGEKGDAGLWALSVADANAARLTKVAPAIGVVVTMLACVVMWWAKRVLDARRTI